ncbi:MAG TPA: stage V sporulation protein B [Clostridiaceae bacterium]|nr:stage V sporulation protein B [Clostridiaceae bacterium]
MSKKSFFSGAIILMIAGLIVRIFGFIYRIYLSNLIGAEGMGLFQLISPVYSLIILTLTSGISIAVSKMVAEEEARGHYINLRRITSCAAVFILICGIIISVLIALNVDFIVKTILKDNRTYFSLLVLLPSIPVIATASALKGYFYGTQDVTPTAISQIVEQIVRIGLVLLMASYFLKLGLEYACALATAGMAIGEVSNLAVLYIIYLARKNRSKRLPRTGILRKRVIFKNMITIATPISFNRFITSIMAAVEYIMIPRMLLAGGNDYQTSIELYGRLTGMAMPLVFFPCIVTSSLATTLVPAISEAMSLKNLRAAVYRISKSIQITFVLGFMFTAVFMTYPKEIGDILYKKEDIGWILSLLSFTCIFVYLQQTLLGIMNGLGKQGVSLRNSSIGYIIRICFVYFCVPKYGIKGYIWGMIISLAIVCILDLYKVSSVTGMHFDIRNWVFKPGIVGIAVLAAGKYIYSFFSIFTDNYIINVVLAVAGNLVISLALNFIIGALDKEELLRLVGFKKYQNNMKL